MVIVGTLILVPCSVVNDQNLMECKFMLMGIDWHLNLCVCYCKKTWCPCLDGCNMIMGYYLLKWDWTSFEIMKTVRIHKCWITNPRIILQQSRSTSQHHKSTPSPTRRGLVLYSLVLSLCTGNNGGYSSQEQSFNILRPTDTYTLRWHVCYHALE